MPACLPHVTIAGDYMVMSRIAANIVLAAVRQKSDSMLCVATGASPVGVYTALAEHRAELGQVRILKLDEWGGLAKDDPATCEMYIRRRILEPWGITSDRFLGFAGDAPDPAAECRRIHEAIDAWGGIDLSILGMGADGHIGLNYPADMFPATATPTDPSTLRHAMLDVARSVPTHGLTLGMGEVLRSRRIVLVVNGEGKAEAVRQLLSGQITTRFPASLLWLHPETYCVLDQAAASKL